MPDQLDRVNTALAGRYTIERELGAGGMATVYLAHDPRHQRKVALKVLRPDLAATLGPERFLREITIAANLQHPHILPVYDSGQAERFLYYVMPFVEGESLRERLASHGELPVSDAVRILRDVADAMAAAHAKGVVHRDIKPENIMLSGRHALVADFGVARAVSEATGRQTLTTAGVALGTPAYMAPEQAAADPHTDHRADLYAFGVTAYEMLTGQPPFTGASPQAVLAAHVTEAPVNVTQRRATIPPVLARLVMRCLEKKPADRPQSTEDLLLTLESIPTPSGGITPTQTHPVTAMNRPGRRRLAVVITGALGIAALAVGGYALWGAPSASGLDANRVAVIRFENRTGVDTLGTLGLILADAITNDLNRSGVVSAVPTMSVAQVVEAATAGGAPLALRVIAEETGAGTIVSGSYFLQGDSLAVQAEVLDAAHERSAAPVDLVLAPAGDTRAMLDLVRQRVQIALSARVNPLLGRTHGLIDLPVSLDAYRKYADGFERYAAADFPAALRLFYEALAVDSTSVTLRFDVAVTEWNANHNIARTDSLLRQLEPRRSEMAPFDRACYDDLRAWTDGDLEGALRASRVLADLDPLWGVAAALDAFRANRWVEARRFVRFTGRSEMVRTTVVRFWEMDTRVRHWYGDYAGELEAARRGEQEFGAHRALLQWEIRALAALGRGAELRERLEALRIENPQSNWLEGAVWELRAHGHAALADSVGQQVVTWYRAELEKDSAPSLRRAIAATLFDRGDLNEAKQLFERLYAEDAEDRTALGYLGVIAARHGDTTEANAAIARLGAITTPYIFGDNIVWQGYVAATLGQCERAVAYFAEATRQGAPYTFYMDGRNVPDVLLVPIADCPAFKTFVEPKG